MADYEKLRRKREAEAMARLEREREERRLKEEKERQRQRQEIEKRHWDKLGLKRQNERHSQDVEEATRKGQALVKQLEEKKRQSQMQS